MTSFQEQDEIGKISTGAVEALLRSLSQTVKVENVETDPNYRKKDIDLIWTYQEIGTGSQRTVSIEVKGDKHEPNNFYFETVSNSNKQDLGCFMYSEADLWFYHFQQVNELYVFRMPATREWFQNRINEFRDASGETTGFGGTLYESPGKLVPVKLLLSEVPSARMPLSEFDTILAVLAPPSKNIAHVAQELSLLGKGLWRWKKDFGDFVLMREDGIHLRILKEKDEIGRTQALPEWGELALFVPEELRRIFCFDGRPTAKDFANGLSQEFISKVDPIFREILERQRRLKRLGEDVGANPYIQKPGLYKGNSQGEISLLEVSEDCYEFEFTNSERKVTIIESMLRHWRKEFSCSFEADSNDMTVKATLSFEKAELLTRLAANLRLAK